MSTAPIRLKTNTDIRSKTAPESIAKESHADINDLICNEIDDLGLAIAGLASDPVLSGVTIDNGYLLISGVKAKAGYADISGIARECISADFISGTAGAGHKLSGGELELTNLSVRGRITANEFLVRKVRAVGGSLMVSSGAKIEAVTSSSGATHTVNVKNGLGVEFDVDDIIICQQLNGTNQKYYKAQVTAVSADTFTFDIILGSGIPAAGDELVQVDNLTDVDRKGMLYLTNSDTNAPYLDVAYGYHTSPSSSVKVRLGRLDGIIDPDFGALAGWGFYGQNVYLTNAKFKGEIQAVAGSNVPTKDEVDDKIDSIQIGTVNLFDNGDTERAAETTYLGINITAIASIRVGKELTIAFDVKTETAGSFYFYTLGQYRFDGEWINSTTTWQRTKRTVVITDNGDGSNYCDLSFYSTQKPYVKNIVIVEGNRVEASWFPSLNDAERIAAESAENVLLESATIDVIKNYDPAKKEVIGTTVRVVAGDGNWTNGVYSRMGFKGGAYVRFTVSNAAKYYTIGLTTNPGESETYGYYLFLIPGEGFYKVESGVWNHFGGTYVNGDIIEVLYDGEKIIYRKNGVNLGTTVAAISDFLYALVGAITPSEIKQVAFGSYTDPVLLASKAAAALAAAADAQDAADGKIDSFYQTSAPSIANEGDIWFDTDDGNKIYTYRSGVWVNTQDSKIAQAISSAQNAQTTADGKAGVYYQTSAPSGKTIDDKGDIWIDTDDNNKMYVWSGSAWALAQDYYTALTEANKAPKHWENASLVPASGYNKGDRIYQTVNQSIDGYSFVGGEIYESDTKRVGSRNMADFKLVEDASAAISQLADLANDNKLTPNEKQAYKLALDKIKAEYPVLLAKYVSYHLTTTTFRTAYNTLDSYLSPILTDLTTTSAVTGAWLRSYMNDYEAAKLALESKSIPLQGGGRNYFRPYATSITTLSGTPALSPTATGFNANGVSSFRLNSVITNNGAWTIGFEFYSGSGTGRVNIDIADEGSKTYYFQGSAPSGLFADFWFNTTDKIWRFYDGSAWSVLGAGAPDVIVDGNWIRVKHTTYVTGYGSGATYNFVDISLLDSTNYFFRNVKVESGNRATGFSVAPEDVNSALASMNAAIDDTAEKTSALTYIGSQVINTGVMMVGNGTTNTGFISGVIDDGWSSVILGVDPGGYASKATARFRVTLDGHLYATDATISGAITATSGSFSGSIYASSGTIAGFTINSNEITSYDGVIQNYFFYKADGDFKIQKQKTAGGGYVETTEVMVKTDPTNGTGMTIAKNSLIGTGTSINPALTLSNTYETGVGYGFGNALDISGQIKVRGLDGVDLDYYKVVSYTTGGRTYLTLELI